MHTTFTYLCRSDWGHADQDSVRLLAVECCGPLAQLSGKEDTMSSILPVVQKFSQARPLSCHRRRPPDTLTRLHTHLHACAVSGSHVHVAHKRMRSCMSQAWVGREEFTSENLGFATNEASFVRARACGEVL